MATIKPEPKDRSTIEGILRDAVSDAVDFIESEIADDRIKAQRYFDGEVDIGEEDGRSRVVATKVRDTVRGIKPSLMRVFLSSDRPVEYVPRGPEDVQPAQQATQYMHWRFNELGGFNILSDAIHDALVKKTGIVKAYWDTYSEAETYKYSNLTEAEFFVITNEDDVEVIEHRVEMEMAIDPMGMEIETPKHFLTVSRSSERGRLMIEAVPPEEFFVDRNARSIDDYYVCGHRRELRVHEVVAMGFDFDTIANLDGIGSSDTYSEAEDFERRGYQMEEEESVADPSMKLVAITEAYMQMDIQGTGSAQTYRFLLGGSNYELLDYEPCGRAPFAVFEIDPEPHAFFGRSIPDLISDDQDAATAMLRGVLDNIALVNNPRLEFVEGQVNVDDLLNNEIGGLIRTKTQGVIQPMTIPFVAGTVLPALQYYDDLVDSKTGVSKASMGLDPDALQNTTATAAQLTAQQGAGQVEVMARNLAEGGMRQLFRLMLRLFVENSNEQEMMSLGGNFVPIDPRVWNVGMDVSVNVGLGTGKEDQKAAALMQALQMQMQVWQAYGPGNGLVTMTGIRNTLADMLAIGGLRNAERYFSPMNEQTEQMLIQQKQAEAASRGQPMDPQAAYLQAEQMKAQAKLQSDQFKMQLEAQKALAEDDRKRDEMDQDLLIEAAKILGQYGTAVDVERVKALQAQARYPDQAPAQAIPQARY